MFLLVCGTKLPSSPEAMLDLGSINPFCWGSTPFPGAPDGPVRSMDPRKPNLDEDSEGQTTVVMITQPSFQWWQLNLNGFASSKLGADRTSSICTARIFLTCKVLMASPAIRFNLAFQIFLVGGCAFHPPKVSDMSGWVPFRPLNSESL